MSDVTVITPAIPERIAKFLPICISSVENQTMKPKAHLVGVDYNRIGAGAICNRLISGVTTEWIAFLADDDFFYLNHIQTLVENADNADVVYSWCNVVGRGNWNPNSHFDPKRLRTGNYIPATVLMRTSTFRRLGGFDETPFISEDWDMWLKVLDSGGKFVCVPIITWEYVFHGQNISDGWVPDGI